MALSARIGTRDGWGVPHAVLTLTDMTGTQVLRAEVDAEGAVRSGEPLAPGAYTVIVTAIGYEPAARTAMVTASGNAEVGRIELARQGGSTLPPPGPWTVDPMHSTVGAVAQHLGISSVRGRFLEFSARIEIAKDLPSYGGKGAGGEGVLASRVETVIRAASVDTGNSMRDGHLRSADFLDVEQHPEITYRSHGLTPVGPDRWTVHGTLSLHGAVREVDLELSYLGSGPDPWGGLRAAFRATAELRREDFAMNYNQVLQTGMAAIGTTLRVELDIQAVQGESLPVA